jgi:1,4-alpha-glucan branching enzyme
VISFIRQDADEKTLFLVVGHFTPSTRENYLIGVPRSGRWEEVINTNSKFYGGAGIGNGGEVHAVDVETDGMGQSLRLTLPPLTTMIFKWTVD